MMDFSKLV